MGTFEDVMAGNPGPLKKLEQALQKEAVGGKQKKQADFAQAYPVIEQHLSRKVPLKVVIDTYGKAYGYVIHAPQFRKMLHTERMRHGETGNEVTCASCGQQLTAAVKVTENVVDTEEHNHVE